MAGEIQLNSTTMATESSGSITAELDTIKPNTNNGSLTLQGDSSGSGVTGITIDSSGNVTLAEKLIIDPAKGIQFRTSTGGSGTFGSGILDDYEEGTWTPTTVTSGTATGYYIKIGRVVNVWLLANSVTFSSFTIGGLPFSVSVATGASGLYDALAPGSGEVIMVHLYSTVIQMEIYNQATGVTNALGDYSGTFKISGTYLTS